jgi:hypothetical protein
MANDVDDWYVPGAFIAAERTIRLRPPREWPRFVIDVTRVPPSMNDNAIRSHWRGFQKEKKSWQGEIEMLLMVERVKRGGYQRAVAGAFMQFAVRAARRDSGNYKGVVEKALGDALVNYGAIEDDDDKRYLFGGVEFLPDLGPPTTRIFLYLQPEEE